MTAITIISLRDSRKGSGHVKGSSRYGRHTPCGKVLKHLDLWQPQAYGPSMIEENRLGVRIALTAENGMHEFFREARILPLLAVSPMK